LIVEMKSGFPGKVRHRVILEDRMIVVPAPAQQTPIPQAFQSIQVATALGVAPDSALDTLNPKMAPPKTLPGLQMGVALLSQPLRARASKMKVRKKILTDTASSLKGGADYALLSGNAATIHLRFAARRDSLFLLRLVGVYLSPTEHNAAMVL
jgi:hypothetical protein